MVGYLSSPLALEVGRYQLTDLEADALSHYVGRPALRLVQTLRDSVAVFHNLAHELWRAGLRLRIVPCGKNFPDIPECADLDPEEHKSTSGMYRLESKLIAIREEQILYSTSVKVKYATFIHEMAHAVWFLLLCANDHGRVYEFFRREKARKSETREYRLQDVHEFFAESFLYYVTPHRKGQILGVSSEIIFGNKIHEVTKEMPAPDVENLRNANPDMLIFLDSKFKHLMDPELVMAQPINRFEEQRFQRWGGGQLLLPVIYSPDEDGSIANW